MEGCDVADVGLFPDGGLLPFFVDECGSEAAVEDAAAAVVERQLQRDVPGVAGRDACLAQCGGAFDTAGDVRLSVVGLAVCDDALLG